MRLYDLFENNLSTERGRLEYYLKKPIEEGMLVRLYKLGKFHQGADPLAEIVPERNGTYALHPDKWESTFYSLTNKDFKKIVHYKPRLIKAPTDMIVADMAIANKFYRTDNPEEQDQLAKEYKDSIGKDVSSMKMPEVIISTSVNEDEVFVTLKKDDIVVKVPKRRVEYFLDRHYKIVEKITKDTPMGDVIKDFYKSDAPQFKGKSKAKKRQMAIAAKLSMNEAVHTFMTGHDVTFGGQKYDEMEIEVTGVDNANKKYNIMILTPKELFGKTVAVSSRYMERGPWTKTKVDNVFEGLKISSNTGFKSGFTVTLTIDDQKAGHFRYYFDDDGAQNDVEVYPEFQGKGYGKLLTLKAMTTADDYDIPFERDSRGVSKAQRGVYSSLERDGLIDNNGVTDKGYDYLEYGEKDAH